MAESPLNIAHVSYLESRSIEIANEIAGYEVFELENLDEPTAPDLGEAEKIKMEEFLEIMRKLLVYVGHPILEKTPRDKSTPKFSCGSRKLGSLGHGRLKGEGKSFVVFQGSTAPQSSVLKNNAKKNTPSHTRRSDFIEKHKRTAEELQKANFLKVKDSNNKLFEFTRDCPFDSPSAAAQFISGLELNGRDAWKTAKGEKLGNLYEKGPKGKTKE